MRFLSVCLIVCLLPCLPGLAGQPVVGLTDYQVEYPLGKFVTYAVDPSGTASITQIRASGQFRESNQHTPSFGFSPAVYWFRLRVRNQSSGPDRRYVLELGYPYFRYVDLYIFDAHNRPIGQTLAGDARGAAHRPLPTQQYVFPLHLKPGEEQIIYLRCDGMASRLFPLTIYEADHFLGVVQRWPLYFGLYFGFILIIALYHLIRYGYTREPGYLLFSLYLFFFWLNELVRGNGNYVERLFFVDHPFWQRHSVEVLNVVITLVSVFGLTFYQQGLQLARNSLLFKTLTTLWLVNAGLLLVLLTGFFPAWLSLAFNFYVPLVGYLAVLVICMIRIRQGFSLAWYYLIGTALLMGGVVIAFFNRIGWLPGTDFYWYNAIQIASISEMLLLSLGFAESYRQERSRKKEELDDSFMHGRKKEREWLSFVMHHQFGSTITFLTKQLNRLNQLPLTESDQRLLTEAQARLVEADKELHTLAISLFPAVLDKYGLQRALEVSVANFDGLGSTRFHIESTGTGWKFEERAEFELYLIGLELLNNVLRHAEATAAGLELHWQTDGVFQLVMRDNGVGFEPKQLAEGHGFSSTRQLVEGELSGQVIIDSNPGEGTTVRIRIPDQSRLSTRSLIQRLFGAIRWYW